MIKLLSLKTGLIILLTLSSNDSLQAQIVSDTTLPSNSIIKPNGNILEINGGTQAGSNLFHSFSEFSLSTGSEVYFNNASTITNIISRVTGRAISNIDGLIQAHGSANLFLINPNGIIFGPNASLNIGGSFLASTANSLRFADGSEFSATNPSASPLLTVTIPIGLDFRQNSSVIRVQGVGHSLQLVEPLIFFSIKRVDSETGLQVKQGKTLALVGGSIDIEGGSFTAEDGRIEIGSIKSGLVSLNPISVGWMLSYEGVESFQDILFTQRALADASGMNSGSIQVQGAHIELSNGSVIWIENRGSQTGGSITVNASGSLKLEEIIDKTMSGDNNNFLTLLMTQATGTGQGGDITVSTQHLLMRGGVNIDALTLEGGARGGNINIYASDSVQLIGESLNSSIIARTQNSGNAGNIIVSTDKLTILNGSNIISPSSLGNSNAGNVTVNASQIELIGINQQNFLFLPSSISSLSGNGNAGTVEINTSRLILRSGGQVSTSTLSAGDAGSVIIKASEFVDVSGNVPGTANPTQIISSANAVSKEEQAFFGISPVPSGASGSVMINTPQLIITDGAQVTVRNDGTGSAGTLLINTDSIFLDHRGGITASTVSGEGGNIILNVQDILQLRNNSFITSTAGGTGNGGNITINTRFLIGSENSDITANSFGGKGGAINITAPGVIGFSVQDNRETSSNDITAFSEQGTQLNGIVELNTQEIDLSGGLLQLPKTVVDTTSLVAQNFCQQGKASELTISGRGGLPPNINEDLSSEAVQVGLVEPVPIQSRQTEETKISTPATSTAIEPVQGWIFNEKGQVVLTAYNPTVTEPQRLPSKSATCSTP
jgi:filamentous hemagglutinin family protein